MTSNAPDTVMSRALAERAVRLGVANDERTDQIQPGMLDLITPRVPPLPEYVADAARSALDRGETHYTSRPGVLELRAAIAEDVRADGIPASVDTVVITNGGAEAVYIALQATLQPGDRVAVVEPVAPNVIDMIHFIGADLVRVQPPAANRFHPAISDLPASSAQALLLTTPSPVSGIAIPAKEIQELLRVAVDRGIVPILDRSLAGCLYDPRDDVFDDQDLMSQVITIGSFSTAHGLGGWRVGYFTAPDERAGDLAKLKQAMSICTTAVSQFAALAALQGPIEWREERRRGFADRKTRAIEWLRAAGIDLIEPDAYPPLLLRAGYGSDDVDLVTRLRDEAGVAVQAGSRFGAATHGFVRINLDADDDTLFAGIDRIATFIGNEAPNGSR